ncbi:MAG: hypothetical protein WA951_14805, partial [Leeuwenhoekiella sp.]
VVLQINQLYALVLSVIILVSLYFIYLDNQDQLSQENVVRAYYDAIDFKEFERAHSYLDPDGGKTIAQFMLEVSVSDGILSSYAKLDSIHVNINEVNDTVAVASAFTSWVTPIEIIEKEFEHELKKINGNWFIEPTEMDTDLPADQLFSQNETKFFNHGRRRITTQQTQHEDVLKQPVLEVLSAKLVEFQGRYSIIGEIQNVDHVPADVVINGTLYDGNNNELASYNARQVLKHKLMPKEISSFRVDFEGIAWLEKDAAVPETFNPDEFTPIELASEPVKFNLQCAGNVATTDLYKSVTINELRFENGKLQGKLFNYGVEEVTIPQLIYSYYDEESELKWVDHQYLREGIRVQRKQSFSRIPEEVQDVCIIDSTMKNVYINGLPNKAIAGKVVPKRKIEHRELALQKLEGQGYSSIKIEVNNYIGNPK